MTRAKRHAISVARLKRHATEAERRFCCVLAMRGIAYRFQQGFYHPYYRIVDFFVPSLNLAIEIDGPCHDPEMDRIKDEQFTRTRGIEVLRFTNEEILSGNFSLPVGRF